MIRAALKSLLGRKLRLLMSTFAIVLGVGFVAGSLIFGDTLNRSFTALFASTVGDVVVRPAGNASLDGVTSVTIPAELGEQLAAVDGAARADGQIGVVGVYVLDTDGDPIGGNGPPALGGNWSDAPAGNDLLGLEVLEGRAPTAAGEVAIDDKTVEKSGYEIGDTVNLVTTSETPELDVTLVGIVGFSEGGSLNGATFTAFDTAAAQELFLDGKDVYNTFWVTADDGVTQEELRDRVAEVLPAGFEAVTGDEASDESADTLLDQLAFITTFLLIFAVIALVVGSFLIVNTFSILVAQRSRELALLRALGASRRQVKWMVLLEAFVLGVIGATLGLGLGVLLFFGIRAAFASFGLDLSTTPMVFHASTVMIGYAIGIGVTMIAAWFPARRTGRIPPVAALRDDIALPESTIRRRLILGAGAVILGAVGISLALYGDVPKSGYVLGIGTLAVLLGVSAASPVLAKPLLLTANWLFTRTRGAVGQLAGQNSLRNPRRTAATASALMIGLALCTTMAMVGASAKASVDQAVKENFVGDLVVSNVFGIGFSPTVADRAEALEGVAAVSRVRFQYVQDKDGSTKFLQGIDPATVTDTLKVDMVEGTLDAVNEPGSVLISEAMADDDDLDLGDTVELKVPVGDTAYVVAGIYELNPVLGDSFVLSLDALAEAGYVVVDNFVFVTLAEGADREQVQAELEGLVEAQKMVSVKDQDGLAEEQRGPIDQLLTLIYGLLALALVIAVLGIVNTLALSVIERTREVGLLRAIGLSRRQLRQMIRLESIVIAILGAVLGILLGLIFGWVLLSDLASQGLEVIAVPWIQLVVFLAISLVVGVLAAVFPARRAARLDVLEAISTE